MGNALSLLKLNQASANLLAKSNAAIQLVRRLEHRKVLYFI